jgi:predicted O-linked N-acetylglucosamine transferase (SPINDLY family)
MFAIWMRLLTAVPGSVLWLLKSNGIAMNNLRREAEALGVAADRLVFAPFVTPAQHLARHRLANLFLDTQFYNAHTTMSDALWTGLPAVTCPGRTFASRVGGSLLHAIGLPDLIAPNLEEYEKLALKLAQDPALLNGFRERLAANRLKAPLFDSQSYARHIESAYVHMFDQFMTASPPASFRVEPDSKIAAFA